MAVVCEAPLKAPFPYFGGKSRIAPEVWQRFGEVRNKDLYRQEMACADAVRDWAVANGDNPLMRIALCGYQGEHELPGWSVLEWSASGGYEGQAEKKTNNRKKERIWFSPHCLKPDVQGSLFGKN